MRIYFITLAILAVSVSFGQQKPSKSDPATTNSASATASIDGTTPPKTPKTGPKPYKEVITDKAITNNGLFTVHKVEEKYYFEIADSIMGREIYAITRFSKAPGGGGIYGGNEVNKQTLKFEKGPNNNVFVRVAVSYTHLTLPTKRIV